MCCVLRVRPPSHSATWQISSSALHPLLPAGAGKSTLLKLLMGREEAQEGTGVAAVCLACWLTGSLPHGAACRHAWPAGSSSVLAACSDSRCRPLPLAHCLTASACLPCDVVCAVELGAHGVMPNYFEQNQAAALDLNLTVMDTLVRWVGRCCCGALQVRAALVGQAGWLSLCVQLVQPSMPGVRCAVAHM
jgi:hypothetical protein